MSYHALARKYRPATFAQVVGQKHVTGTLRAALRKQKLAHAYLFSGPRGCGKTTVARLLAKALNCTQGAPDEPCGRCERCQAIAAGADLDVLEIDAASHTGVDNIRDLRDMAQYTPTQGACRVFIIDEVHMLSKGAFNALLKILEEPPARVFFFFATTEPHKVPRTILSRCQRFDFRLLARDELAARLSEIAAAEGAQLAPTGLRLLIALAEGSLRDALSLLDQLIAGAEGPIDEAMIVAQFGLVRADVYLELNQAIIARDAPAALRLLDRLLAAGDSLDTFAQGLAANFRDLLLLRLDPELGATLDLPPETLARLQAQAQHFAAQDLLALLDRAGRHYERIHRSTQPRVLLEAALVEFALFESRVLLSDLAHRLGALDGEDPAAAAGGGQGAGEPARRGRPAAAAAGREPPGVGGGPSLARETPPAAAAAGTLPLWTELVGVLMQSHPGVAACLLEGFPSLDEARGRLTLAFPAEKSFQMERLEQERAVVLEKLAAVLGRPLQLVLTVAGETGRRDLRDALREEVRRAVAPTENESLAAACQADPRLADLVELLEGEAVPAAEREDWQRAPAPDGGAAAQ